MERRLYSIYIGSVKLNHLKSLAQRLYQLWFQLEEVEPFLSLIFSLSPTSPFLLRELQHVILDVLIYLLQLLPPSALARAFLRQTHLE